MGPKLARDLRASELLFEDVHMEQKTFAMAADQIIGSYRKPTRRDEFLKTMEAVVP